MLIPDPRRTPLPNLISHNGIILYQWEFLRARLDEGEGLPWIAMDFQLPTSNHTFIHSCHVKLWFHRERQQDLWSMPGRELAAEHHLRCPGFLLVPSYCACTWF